MSVITIERKVLEKNDAVAGQNREVFLRHGIFAINIVSSPGSGKTSLLECTLSHIKNRVNVAVIEGDVQTDLDAQRVSALGVPAVQIVTKGGCHLDAPLVKGGPLFRRSVEPSIAHHRERRQLGLSRKLRPWRSGEGRCCKRNRRR